VILRHYLVVGNMGAVDVFSDETYVEGGGEGNFRTPPGQEGCGKGE